jgi:hypothetical protein
LSSNEDPESVLSDLKGHLVLKDGIANFSSLSFGVPGAPAQLHGTYDLVSERLKSKGELTGYDVRQHSTAQIPFASSRKGRFTQEATSAATQRRCKCWVPF